MNKDNDCKKKKLAEHMLFIQGVVYHRQQQIKFTHSHGISPMYHVSAGGSNCDVNCDVCDIRQYTIR